MKSIQLLKKDLFGLNGQAVADPEEFQGFAQTPPPPPHFLMSYENEIIGFQWDQIISFS